MGGHCGVGHILNIKKVKVMCRTSSLLLGDVNLGRDRLTVGILDDRTATFSSTSLLLIGRCRRTGRLRRPGVIPVRRLTLYRRSRQKFLIVPVVGNRLLSLLLSSPFRDVPSGTHMGCTFVLVGYVVRYRGHKIVRNSLGPDGVLVSSDGSLCLFSFDVDQGVGPAGGGFTVGFGRIRT